MNKRANLVSCWAVKGVVIGSRFDTCPKRTSLLLKGEGGRDPT